MKYLSYLFIVGFSLFSMFFGGGNLVFPLLVGMSTSSPLLSIFGFVITSILLPFYGVLVGLYFKGDYEKCLGAFGKTVAHVLIFALLVFWIPLGSGPRCNQLAYGAFAETGITEIPLWLHSLIYSCIVYILTVQRGQFLEILGKVVTPFLIFFLFVLICSLFSQPFNVSLTGNMAFEDFLYSFFKGYNTMDFIAAIFFSSSIIGILREQKKGPLQLSFIRNAYILAIFLLCVVYTGMFFIGCLEADRLTSVSGAQLLATVGHLLLGDSLNIVIFMIITLSVLSTSMALSLVFSDYLYKSIFQEKLSYQWCLCISVGTSFVMSIMGFERLSVFISIILSVLYPILLVTTTVSAGQKYIKKKSDEEGLEKNGKEVPLF